MSIMKVGGVVVFSALTLLVLVAMVITIPVETSSRKHSKIAKLPLPAGRPLRFHLVGDYGALVNTSDTLSKVAPIPVELVSSQMSNRSLEYPIDFIATTGDNVYPDGMKDVFDKTQFELMYSVFRKQGLWGKPWYPVLGNHDCENTPPMIDISTFYPMWNLPTDYFNLTVSLDSNSTAVLIFLNGCTIACQEKLIYCDYPYSQAEIDQQYTWLESVLSDPATAEAAWIMVFIHMPLFGAGSGSGDNDALKLRLYPLLCEYQVDFLIAGHEHLSEYLFSEYGATYVPADPSFPINATNCLHYDEYFPPASANPLFVKKGVGLHEVVVGASGHDLDTLCVDRTTSMAELLFGSTTWGWAEISLSSAQVTVNFMSIQYEQPQFTLIVEA